MTNAEFNFSCAFCHYDTVQDLDPTDGWTLAAGADHLPDLTGVPNGENGPHNIDIIASVSDYGKFSYDDFTEYLFDSGKKRCFKSCHGSFTELEELFAPQWGGSRASPSQDGCFFCHGGIEDSNEPRPMQTADNWPNIIDKFQYENNGHGNITTYAGGNTGASFNYYEKDRTAPGCYSMSYLSDTPTSGCHYAGDANGVGAPKHYPTKLNNDPYRLGATFASDTNGLCLYCHGPSGIGSTVKAVTHSKASTGSRLTTWSDEWGTAMNPPKCVDCHDPHGDDNAYMVKNEISRDFGSTDYGSPSTGGNAPNDYLTAGYDPALMIPVEFHITPSGYEGRPGQAGDYFNRVADGMPNGICQICHYQNLEYNNLEEASTRPDEEVKTHANTLDPIIDPSDVITDFLPDDGRRCTECHVHYYNDNTQAFKVPSIDWNDYPDDPNAPLPLPDPQEAKLGPKCTDCHLWNPNGQSTVDIYNNTHPLYVDKDFGGPGAGGLKNILGNADPDDQNDDIDNYDFNGQPPPIAEGQPDMANYTDRAMIDAFQWNANAHGTPTSQSLLDTNSSTPNGGPEFNCAGTTEQLYDPGFDDTIVRPAFDGCHDQTVNHGDGTNPFRLLTVDIGAGNSTDPNDLCRSCHESMSGPHRHSIFAFGDVGTPMFEAGKCPDCHDPHGDTAKMNLPTSQLLTGIDDDIVNNVNAAMIQREVIYEDRWTTNYGVATGHLYAPVRYFVENGHQGDFAKQNTSYSGICEGCHLDENVRFFRRENQDLDVLPDFHDENQEPYACTDCHSHTVGFACGGCHAFPPLNSPFHDEHVYAQGFWCEDCHEGNMSKPHPDNTLDPSIVINDNVDIWFSEEYLFEGGTEMLNGEPQGPPVWLESILADNINGPFTGSGLFVVKRPNSYVYSHASPVTCRIGCHNPVELYPARKEPDLDNAIQWDIKHKPNDPEPPLPDPIKCSDCHAIHGVMANLGTWTDPDDPQLKDGEITFKSAHQTTVESECLVCHDFTQHRQGKVRLQHYGTSTVTVFDTDDDKNNTVVLEGFCLSCHSGQETAEPFPLSLPGITPPDVDKFLGWNDTDTSAHKRGGTPYQANSPINLTCVGFEVYNVKFPTAGVTTYGCHQGGHGSPKQRILLSYKRSLTQGGGYFLEEPLPEPDNVIDREGFCYPCHGRMGGFEKPTSTADGGTKTTHRWDDIDGSGLGGFDGGQVSCMACHRIHSQGLDDPAEAAAASGVMWQNRGAYPSITTITDDPIIGGPLTSVQYLCFDCHDGDAPVVPGLPDLNTIDPPVPSFAPLGSALIKHQDISDVYTNQCEFCHSHGTGFGSCAGCHEFPPSDEAHYTHTIQYGFSCFSCHYGFNDPVINPYETPTNPTGKSGHPSKSWLETGVKNPFINFPMQQYADDRTATEPKDVEFCWFPGGTRINNNYASSAIKAAGDVTCYVGCHNPALNVDDRKSRADGTRPISKDNVNSIMWYADMEPGDMLACTACHDDVEDKFTYATGSKHPVHQRELVPPEANDAQTRADCEECHGPLIYPSDEFYDDEGQRFYHTNYRKTEDVPIAWPTTSKIPLWLQNEATYSFLPITVNETTMDTAYTVEDDPTDVDLLEPFCLSCHNGDYAECDDQVFSEGAWAPNIERYYYWERSSHNTGGDVGVHVSCFGTPDMSYAGTGLMGCHGNAHGNVKKKLLSRFDEAAGANNALEEEGFCYKCHTDGTGIINWSLSGLKNTNGLCGTPPLLPMYDDIQQGFSYGSHHPVDDAEQASRGVPSEVECTTCHPVHWASGKWADTPNGKGLLWRVGTMERTKLCGTNPNDLNQGQGLFDLLWGDDPDETAEAYAAKFSGVGREADLFLPDHYCCDGQKNEPAEYFLPKAWYGNTYDIPDTATFCLDCHTTSSKVRANYIIGAGCGWENCNSWNSDMHGGGRAGRSSAGGDSFKWWTGDAEHPYGCDRDAGIGLHFIRNNENGYTRQAERERIQGINYVMVCTDCHDGHGGGQSLFKDDINANASDTCERGLSASGAPSWNTICNQCHYYYGGHHAGMSCGNASCHERNSIHKAKKMGSGGDVIIVFDGSDCSFPPASSDPVIGGLVGDFPFDEGTGTVIDNKATGTLSGCTYCGGAGGYDMNMHLTGYPTYVDWGPGVFDTPGLFFKPSTAGQGVAQKDYYTDISDGYPIKFGPIQNFQNETEFTVEAWINPSAIECSERTDKGNLNTVLRRDIVSTNFWVKNWAISLFRYSNDGWEIGGNCTTEGPDHDVIKFQIAVGDPNDMVYDYWCGTWPQTVFPVSPNYYYSNKRHEYDCVDGSAVKTGHLTRGAVYSFALTKTKWAKDQGQVPACTPVVLSDGDYDDPSIGNWQHVMGTWDGRYIRIFLDGELAAETDMGGTGDYVMLSDPLYWGGTGVNRHVTAPFEVGAHSVWITADNDGNGLSDGADFWNANADYDQNSSRTYVGGIDEVKYWNVSKDREDVRCNGCHPLYPNMSASHQVHFTGVYGPQDQKTDDPTGTCYTGSGGVINNCDNCHGADASYGQHVGHDRQNFGRPIVFADPVMGVTPLLGADGTGATNSAVGTRACDTCHGVDIDDPAQGWRLQVRNNWDNDRDYWINSDDLPNGEVDYCGACHGVVITPGLEAGTLSTINTDVGTGGTDAGGDIIDVMDYYTEGHSAPYDPIDNPDAINKPCTVCHTGSSAHIDPQPQNNPRMVNDPTNPGFPYDPFTDDQACNYFCHDGTFASGKSQKQPVSTHSNNYNPPEMPFVKQEQDFPGPAGIGNEGMEIRCIRCHNVHGTSNLGQIRDDDFYPPDGTDPVPIVYTARTGPGSLDPDDGEAPGEFGNTNDLCVVCHVYRDIVSGNVIGSSMVSSAGGDHTNGSLGADLRGTDCIKCHLHNNDCPPLYSTKDGFMPRVGLLCLDCHTTGGSASATNTDIQFDGLGNELDNGILSQHLIKYDDTDYTAADPCFPYEVSKENIECIKCHGNLHPTPDKRVVNPVTGVTYSTSDFGGREPDDLTEFCLGCHDGDFGLGQLSDIQFGGVGSSGTAVTLPANQLPPRYRPNPDPQTVGPWNPNPPDPAPETGLPTSVEKYTQLYFSTGHGSAAPLAANRQVGPSQGCTDCHDYHGTKSYRLVKDLPGKYDGSVIFSYNGEAYNTYDDWCSWTCHAMVDPAVTDHAGPTELMDDLEAGDTRDGQSETGYPPDHPTSMYVPDPLVSDVTVQPIATIKTSGIVGQYLSPPGLNNADDVLCVTCHDPHGTNPPNQPNPHMVRSEWGNPVPDNPTDFCRQCH
jgi:hypothetical protein